ncbi:MAG: TAXI family TRAP transporter solute-binding subunit [Hyphomicrobiaceae bacterium]
MAIVAGKSSSTYLPMVEDLTAVLDKGEELRILAVVGRGPAQNVRDALFLRNMDMGITQSNVLAHFKKTGELGPNLEGRLVYITKLFNEEVHLIAGPGIDSIKDLAGKPVNFGEVGGGADLTARAIVDALKVNVTAVNFSHADAMLKLASGEIAASFLVAGKPTNAFDKLRGGSDFKLLPIQYEEALEADYLPSRLTHEDYPDFIQTGQSIDTVAVSAVLAAYNWAPNSDRGRRLTKFVDAFLGKFAELRKDPRHPKWREVNLLAEVPGWQRLPAAKTWLERRVAVAPARPAPAAVNPKNFKEFLDAQRTGGSPALAAAATDEALFKKFLEWMQSNQANQGRNPDAAATGGPSPKVDNPNVPRLW